MKRKIIQLAGTTYVVSLPLKWVRAQNIKKGDEIDLNIKENQIILTIGKYEAQGERKEISLEAGAPKRYIKSTINNLFRRGVTELIINFDNPKIIPTIQEALSDTMGYELIAQKQKNCTVKNVAGIYEEEFPNLLRRLFLMVLSMGEESLGQLKANTLEKNVYVNIKKTTEKIMNSCCQILNTTDKRFKTKSKFTYLIVFTLEKIANEFTYAIKNIEEDKVKLNKEVVGFYGEVVGFLRQFYEIYYSKKAERVVDLTRMKNKLLDEGYKLTQKVEKKEIIVVHHLLNIVRRTYDMSGPFLGETL